MAFCHSVFAYRGRHSLTGVRPRADLVRLEVAIGHKFSDRDLIAEALTHSSAKLRRRSYERLEFLGDRVLGLILADYFYAFCPDEDEGQLSLRFHAAARQSTLAAIARKLDLAAHVTSQPGMDVFSNDSVMSDLVESLVAALYLDGGIDLARAFVLARWPLDAAAPAATEKDAKSRLQEYAMSKGLALPFYSLVSREGPDHAPMMTYSVAVDGYGTKTATAGARKHAEQQAAMLMLERIEQGTSSDG
jgi:ribonuclease-3